MVKALKYVLLFILYYCICLRERSEESTLFMNTQRRDSSLRSDGHRSMSFYQSLYFSDCFFPFTFTSTSNPFSSNALFLNLAANLGASALFLTG